MTCIPTGDQYIGSSTNLRNRLASWPSALKTSKGCNKKVCALIQKHGPSAFSLKVLELCSTERRFKRERHWIKKLKASLNKAPPPRNAGYHVTTIAVTVSIPKSDMLRLDQFALRQYIKPKPQRVIAYAVKYMLDRELAKPGPP